MEALDKLSKGVDCDPTSDLAHKFSNFDFDKFSKIYYARKSSSEAKELKAKIARAEAQYKKDVAQYEAKANKTTTDKLILEASKKVVDNAKSEYERYNDETYKMLKDSLPRGLEYYNESGKFLLNF